MSKKPDEKLLTEACERVRAETGFEAGAEIRSTRLLEALGVPDIPNREAGEADRPFIKRCERHRLAHVAIVQALRERLLTVHNVDIQATGRGGYRIIPPAVQGPQAAKDGLREARKALRMARKRIEHVDLAKLDAVQKASRDAALLSTSMRLDMLRGRALPQVLEDAEKAQEEREEVRRSAMPRMRRPAE